MKLLVVIYSFNFCVILPTYHLSTVYVDIATLNCSNYFIISTYWSGGSSVRQWPGRPGFNLKLSLTKDSKNDT